MTFHALRAGCLENYRNMKSMLARRFSIDWMMLFEWFGFLWAFCADFHQTVATSVHPRLTISFLISAM